MSDNTNFMEVMRANTEKRIEEIRRDHGMLAGYLRDTQAGLNFNGKVWETKLEISSNQSFHHRWDGEVIDSPTGEQFLTFEWLPRLGYAVTEWSNNFDEMTTNPETSPIRFSTYRTTKTIVNSMNHINGALWANGAGEKAYISQAEDTYTGGVLYFKKTSDGSASVGGKGVTASAKYHRFSNINLEVGERVDLIDGTNHVPRAGATRMVVSSVPMNIDDDTAGIVAVTGPTAKITGLAIGDYFVRSGDIDDGSTGGSTGASKAPFGMLCFAGNGDPAGSVTYRYPGGKSASTYPQWDSGYYNDAAETGTNLPIMAMAAIQRLQKWSGDPDTLICAPNVEMQWWNQFKSNIYHTNTLTVEGGYEGAYIIVGGKRLFFTSDWGCPRGTLFVFPRKNVVYAVKKAFHLADQQNMLAGSKIDKTSVVFKETYNLICKNRKHMGMVINIP